MSEASRSAVGRCAVVREILYIRQNTYSAGRQTHPALFFDDYPSRDRQGQRAHLEGREHGVVPPDGAVDRHAIRQRIEGEADA